MLRALLLLALSVTSPTALAHLLAPALLEWREVAPERFEVSWRTSLVRVMGSELQPLWPEACAAPEERLPGGIQGDAFLAVWQVDCRPASLIGQPLGVAGLERAGINVVLRFQRLGHAGVDRLLDAGQPVWIVEAAPRSAPPVWRYFLLGFEHLLLGLDHVLFVLGLSLILPGLRARVIALSAFTVGHTVTLTLAALDRLIVPVAMAEVLIALSVLWLAVEALRGADGARAGWRRWPWLPGLGFGLFHGLGFAGELSGIGLPTDALIAALLGFTLGIEAGQLLLVLLAAAAARFLPRPAPGWAATLPAQCIGVLAGYWCWSRAFDWALS